MRLFDTDIKKLYGVGAARAQRYAALGVQSVGDFLCHYPRGYEDRGNIKLIAESDGVSKAAYLLTVASMPKSVRVKGRMTLLKFRVYDESAACEITFFNQEYLKNTFILIGIGRPMVCLPAIIPMRCCPWKLLMTMAP